jgi:hypothetical protein
MLRAFFYYSQRSLLYEAPRSATAPDTQGRPAQRLPDENANERPSADLSQERIWGSPHEPRAAGGERCPDAHRMGARRAAAVG